ncbi:MAG: acetolactate synthase small subunit [Candidatus Hadarchaeales archaeon]
MKKRIFSILCQNIPGVMMRITRDFTRRQINLDSITVGLEPSGLARIILMFNADDKMAEFMRKIIARLEPIVSVEVIDPEKSVVREVALLKTRRLDNEKHWKVVDQIERAGGKIIDSSEGAIIAEISGDHDLIENLISSLGANVIKEIARSGQVYISKEL